MSQHAKGPWTVILGRDECREMSRIVQTHKSGHQPEPMLIGYALREWANVRQQQEDDANARLMAASPDLLAACEAAHAMIQSSYCEDGETIEMAERLSAAIARAKGVGR
jgi:hypothetical protein